MSLLLQPWLCPSKPLASFEIQEEVPGISEGGKAAWGMPGGGEVKWLQPAWFSTLCSLGSAFQEPQRPGPYRLCLGHVDGVPLRPAAPGAKSVCVCVFGWGACCRSEAMQENVGRCHILGGTYIN